MTVTGPAARRPVDVGPEFPVAFERPGDEALTWELDDMHWPFALTPLAAEYVRLVASGMNDRYEWYGSFPQRWRCGVWNGYAYFCLQYDGTAEAFEVVSARWLQLWTDRIDGTGAWWRDEALPELRALYERIVGVDVDGLSGEALAAAWTDAWEAGHRAWAIHFVAIMGPYQAVEDLADFYEQTIPDAPGSEAMSLMQGYGDDLFEVELGSEALASLASATPAVASALRAGGATREGLLAVDGGPGVRGAARRISRPARSPRPGLRRLHPALLGRGARRLPRGAGQAHRPAGGLGDPAARSAAGRRRRSRGRAAGARG